MAIIPPKKAPPKPQPADNDRRNKYLMWGFIVIGILAIGWMIYASPKEKNLNCSSRNGATSLTGFGSCTEE
jgi:hypothetical protein